MNEVLVEHSPSPMKLDVLGVDDWPIAHESPGEAERENIATETSYIVEGAGSIRAIDDSKALSEPVQFGPDDLVTIMPGTACRWTITEAVERHYSNG